MGLAESTINILIAVYWWNSKNQTENNENFFPDTTIIEMSEANLLSIIVKYTIINFDQI